MENVFSDSRLKLARARRGMTIKSLALATGMSEKSISSYEKGTNPPDDTVKILAKALSYPTSFFYGCDVDELHHQTVSFRSMSKLKAAQRNAAVAAGQVALLFNDWMQNQFDLPKPNILDLSGEKPEIAAAILRQEWGLGDRSIKSMVNLLESNGIKVFSLFENNQEVDAYSFWHAQTPFVFLNSMKSSERSRFDAAHELGHLILHKHEGSPTGPQAEKEANSFASAFLMPEASVRARAIPFPSRYQLISLKKNWLVSVAALTRRLKDLDLITEWHYRTLTIEMSKSGDLKREPEGIQRENSTLLTNVLSELWKDGITRSDIASELNLPLDELNNLLFPASQEPTFTSENRGKKPTLSVV